MTESERRRAKSGTENVDPNKVKWNDTSYKLNEKSVKEYEKNPNKSSGDGDPYVERDSSGQLHGVNGRHRGEAARRQGRTFKARVHTDSPKAPVEQHSPTKVHVPGWRVIVLGGSGGIRGRIHQDGQ